jgi:hypothetical protein
MTNMRRLLDLGQSVWLDYLSRGMTQGLTALANSARTDRDIFETLAIEDVREAADVFRTVFDSTAGGDGFVSLEISPRLARDTEGSVAEARRLWKALDRPNVMIKIPGTREGWPAIERCLSEGINITLRCCSRSSTTARWRRHICARSRPDWSGDSRSIESHRSRRCLSVASTPRSMNAFAGGGSLTTVRGKVALASAHLAYAAFREILRSDRWRALQAKGARPQRLLWASTGTKNRNTQMCSMSTR